MCQHRLSTAEFLCQMMRRWLPTRPLSNQRETALLVISGGPWVGSQEAQLVSCALGPTQGESGYRFSPHPQSRLRDPAVGDARCVSVQCCA